MPGARCTRGLVCKSAQRKRTRAYRYSRNTPAFPAQWLYGLCRALPGDEFVLSPVADRLAAIVTRLGQESLRQLDTSTGAKDHTVLPYASAPYVLRAASAHG